MGKINLTAQDNNTTVNTNVGDIIDISLPSNPSTGFLWQATDTSAGRLQAVQHDPAPNQLGATIKIHFRFLVESAGAFTLNYARPWDELTPPAKWFSVNVNLA